MAVLPCATSKWFVWEFMNPPASASVPLVATELHMKLHRVNVLWGSAGKQQSAAPDACTAIKKYQLTIVVVCVVLWSLCGGSSGLIVNNL